MTINAKFAGTCHTCKGRFTAGTPIIWAKGQPARHVSCPGPAAPAPVAVTGPAATQPTRPVFEARTAAEGWTAYGRRALLFVLAEDVTWLLPDDAIEAAAEAVNVTAASGVSPEALARLIGTQDLLRGLLRGRQRHTAETAGNQALAETPAPVAPLPPAANPPGGSRVPRQPTPLAPAPPAAAPVPVPVAAPVRRVTPAPAGIADPF
jgi:hypothetical protein